MPTILFYNSFLITYLLFFAFYQNAAICCTTNAFSLYSLSKILHMDPFGKSTSFQLQLKTNQNLQSFQLLLAFQVLWLNKRNQFWSTCQLSFDLYTILRSNHISSRLTYKRRTIICFSPFTDYNSHISISPKSSKDIVKRLKTR